MKKWLTEMPLNATVPLDIDDILVVEPAGDKWGDWQGRRIRLRDGGSILVRETIDEILDHPTPVEVAEELF